jgi:hypothetical protein
LSTLTKWGIVAPLAFVHKQNNSRFLNWLVLWGFTNATKSSSGKYALAFDGHHNDPDYVLGSGSIDTVARLGDTISKSTFPKLVDEVDLSSIYMKDIINYMKTAIESKIFRTKFINSKDRIGTRILALTPLLLTSNSPPPIHNSAFMRRIIDRNFSQSESCKKTDQMSIDFENFMRINFAKLKALGDFRNWFIMNNKELVLDKEISPLDLAGKILAEAYQYVSILLPEWFKEGLSEAQLEESLSDNSVDVKHAFEAYIL